MQVHPKKAYIREIKMYQLGEGRFRTHAGYGTAPSNTETTFIPTAPLRSPKRSFMEQCYAEFLCITRRIGLLGFVVRRHTQVQGISGSCGYRRLEIYFYFEI